MNDFPRMCDCGRVHYSLDEWGQCFMNVEDDSQTATHRAPCGGLVVSGYCFDCGTHVPALEQVGA